jgi:alginate O-acetyltransferase complex protein AlgI
MNFTTLAYLAFLPTVFSLYWLLRRRTAQNVLLIMASYIFYGWWDYRFCFLMLASSLVDFFIGLAMQSASRVPTRRALLGFSLLANLGMLGVFKYFGFFTANFQALANAVGWNVSDVTLSIILPVGISFYTFQTLSYTIDIYRRKLCATTSLVDYLAFVSFFPQLVAGPIERATHLLAQFAEPRRFDFDQACQGCRQILWGFFKKLVIADRLAVLVDERFAIPELLMGPELALAAVFFAFQIYCDFSAYSDIAIGTAKLFNIHLMRNFAYPYFSQSLDEFWRRWHISLSTWFRDYVFVPLGGSRTSRLRRAANVMITFLVSGFWHGAAWQFLLWGGINGGAVVCSSSPSRARKSKKATPSDVPGGDRLLPNPLTIFKITGTFAIVCLAWVFFRADTMSDALLIVQKIVNDAFSPTGYMHVATLLDSDKAARKTIVVLLLFVLIEWIQRRRECPLELIRWPLACRWAAYTVLIWATLDLLPQSGGQEFIYFEF